MLSQCPRCLNLNEKSSDIRNIVRFGSYYRKADSRTITRYRCIPCGRTFSTATNDPCFMQKKRKINQMVFELLTSCVSQRRIARVLKINRKTVIRRFLFFAAQAVKDLGAYNISQPRAEEIEFDELITFEHSKLKPLSVFMAVQTTRRRILGFEIAQMPANGPLAKKSRDKYGPRKDERKQALEDLLKKLEPLIIPEALIKSDKNPNYPKPVGKVFPKATHKVVKGRKGAVTGQGEMKKIGFDPIFSLNHSYAMLRANINRLVRRTWCTTKKRERLAMHLTMYAVSHNAWIEKAEDAKRQKANSTH